MEALLVWLSSVVGSVGFILGSYAYLVELTNSYRPCAGCTAEVGATLGHLVCMLSLTLTPT